METQNLLSEEDIKQLLKIKIENKNLDYKERLNWDSSQKDEKIEVVKDILAMANTQDGGKIIFGVRNSDFEFIGLSGIDFRSFDQTKLNDFLHKYTDPKFSCQIYKYTIDRKYVVVIDVPEFQEIPIICKENADSSMNSSKQILKKGQIYIRTEKGSSEIIPSPEEMRELLGRALTKKGDELLSNIERLIKGRPLKTSDESKEKYETEIKEADNFLFQNIGNKLINFGYWEGYAYPTDYNPKRIPDQTKIKELIKKSEVNLRGWNFPHTDHINASNFIKGRQSYTSWERSIEGYRAYQSGLFAWKEAIREDIEGHSSNGNPVLSFIGAIWSITEFFLFFKRYYEEIIPEGDLRVKIVLNRTKDRKLVSLGMVPLWDGYIAKEDSIPIEEDIKVVELKAAYKEIAKNFIKKIFLIFNWDNVSESVIEQWQTKLIERKL